MTRLVSSVGSKYNLICPVPLSYTSYILLQSKHQLLCVTTDHLYTIRLDVTVGVFNTYKMDIVIELFVTLFKLMVSVFRAAVYSIIPAPRKSVKGQVILITGAGSGIGRLMAIEFAKLGAKIVACDISENGNQETAKEVKNIGGEIKTYCCDISKRDQVRELATKVEGEVGFVDILVNNAGIVSGKRLMDCPEHMIVKTMEVNLLAHFWTIKCFLPGMMDRNSGHIVNVASMAGVVGANSLVDYCASKFASVGLTESLEAEIRSSNKDGVLTTMICPYFINTGMFAGCQTRFPWLLPVLDPKETTERIVQAVLTNQTVLYMPRIMYFLAILKAVLPVDASLALHKFFGATTFMDSFIGKQESM